MSTIGAMADGQRIGRPLAADSARTRQRILDVARQLFAARGYESTSNRIIAEEAGLTTGAIYYYFDKKLDIFAAVHDDAQRIVYERFDVAVEGLDTFVDRLRAVLECAHDLNNEDPSLAQFLGSCRVDAARDATVAAAIANNRPGRQRSFFNDLISFGVNTGEIDESQRDIHSALFRTITTGLVDAVSGDRAHHRNAVDGIMGLVEGRLVRTPDRA
jgi:AcrR family transcriptional regulator